MFNWRDAEYFIPSLLKVGVGCHFTWPSHQRESNQIWHFSLPQKCLDHLSHEDELRGPANICAPNYYSKGGLDHGILQLESKDILSIFNGINSRLQAYKTNCSRYTPSWNFVVTWSKKASKLIAYPPLRPNNVKDFKILNKSYRILRLNALSYLHQTLALTYHQ